MLNHCVFSRVTLVVVVTASTLSAQSDSPWKKHIVFQGEACMTAVAGDFTGDGVADIIADTGKGVTRLFSGPAWKETVLDRDHRDRFIHSAAMDVDGDGDLDYIGACYNPGLILWYEQPERATGEPWPKRLVDDQVHGIHGLITGDVDLDGRMDLLATSAQPKQPFPDSLVWLQAPDRANSTDHWRRHVFAVADAPGLTHYIGFGDIDGDGRPDAATGAKGGPTDKSGLGEWFAWWSSPSDPTQPWTKHSLPSLQPGATNIHPTDVNGDGKTDLVASRGHGAGVIWFEGPDWKMHQIDPELKEPHCLGVADIDGDGDTDVATCAFGSRRCVWYENDGQGSFQTHIVGRDQEAYDIRIVDLNGDARLDLLVAGRQSNNVVWYENPGRDSSSGLRPR